MEKKFSLDFARIEPGIQKLKGTVWQKLIAVKIDIKQYVYFSCV
jgi:hypothetical protein